MNKLWCSMIAIFMIFSFVQPGSASSFSDLNEEHQFYEELMFLTGKGIIQGFPNGTFRADANITRGQAAIMLGRALELDGTQRKGSFRDVHEQDQASGFIESAVERGIIQGFPDGTYRADEPVKREQMALFLARAYDLEDAEIDFSDVHTNMVAYDAIRKLFGSGITFGYPDGTFRPQLDISRAEFGAFMYRVMKLEPTPEPEPEPDPEPDPDPAPEPMKYVSDVGGSKRIAASDSEQDLLDRGVAFVEAGESRIFIGYRQASANNQDPVIVRFDEGVQTWYRQDIETSGDDGQGYGLIWDGADTLYGVFSATGTQGSSDQDYRRYTSNGWLTSYGKGGGAKVAVLLKMVPEDGAVTEGTFLYSRLQNGNTNSMQVTGLHLVGGDLVVNANAWFSPLNVNRSPMNVSGLGGSPFDYTIIFSGDLREARSAEVR